MLFDSLLAAASSTALAAQGAVPRADAPVLASASPTLLGFFQVIFALTLVLLAIFAAAWVVRRMVGGQMAGNRQLRVVSGVMVGAKERVVIVEVADTWLVLGVTASEVSTLHTLPKPDLPADEAVPAGPFADRLAGILRARQSAKETV
jgi:flagellar protein FliO/FliZ